MWQGIDNNLDKWNKFSSETELHGGRPRKDGCPQRGYRKIVASSIFGPDSSILSTSDSMARFTKEKVSSSENPENTGS